MVVEVWSQNVVFDILATILNDVFKDSRCSGYVLTEVLKMRLKRLPNCPRKCIAEALLNVILWYLGIRQCQQSCSVKVDIQRQLLSFLDRQQQNMKKKGFNHNTEFQIKNTLFMLKWCKVMNIQADVKTTFQTLSFKTFFKFQLPNNVTWQNW